MNGTEPQVNSTSRGQAVMDKRQHPPTVTSVRMQQCKILIVKDPTLRPVAAAMCPRCHGKLWTDYGLSEENLATVLVCESCGVAYDLIPIFR
jgi:uncharacterized paraquat-inducible protein A